MKLYPNKQILLRRNMRIARIIKKIKGTDKWLVGFYNEKNNYQYSIIGEIDIMDEDEYNIIRNRINTINKLLDD